MSDVQLKPCPFCGVAPTPVWPVNGVPTMVVCESCCAGPMALGCWEMRTFSACDHPAALAAAREAGRREGLLYAATAIETRIRSQWQAGSMALAGLPAELRAKAEGKDDDGPR